MEFVLGIGGVEILSGKHRIEVQIIIAVALAQRLFRDDGLCLAVISTPRSTVGLEKALKLSD